VETRKREADTVEPAHDLRDVKPFPIGRRRQLVPDLQVLLGLGSLVALLAGAVGVAVFLIVSLEDDTSYLSDRHVRYATAIHQAALEAKGIANNERGFLISGNPEFVKELEAHTVEAREAFAAANGYAVGAREREAVGEARAGFERWLRALRPEFAAYRAGFRQRAVEMSLGPTRQLRKANEQSLARAHALGLRSVESATNSVSASASRSVTILLVYLAFALVLGLAIAFWIVRTLLKPAYRLTRNALEVLTNARILVDEDARGSHYAVGVEVPIEVVNPLGDSVLEAQEVLRAGTKPAE
jgi:CHASE3 domain sensor protein